MTRLILVLIILLPAFAATSGELTDHGPGGLAFVDAGTGLYWLDPEVFLGSQRQHAVDFADHSVVWDLATSAQIDGLVGATIPPGGDFEAVLGARQASVASDGPRWQGFYAEPLPSGWLIQSLAMPFEVIDGTGQQSMVELAPHGAWLVATVDPVAAPRLDHLGSADNPYFHDQETGLYWCDPHAFLGLGRAGVDAWLIANPDWRWATLDEVYGLQGRFTVGDVALADVLGPRQVALDGGGSRWLGYCGNTTATDAVLLQDGLEAPYAMVVTCGIQSMADDALTAAWIVSETNPTPVASRSLTGVKSLYR